MTTYPNRFADYERQCGAETGETKEVQRVVGTDPHQGEQTETVEIAARCEATLTFADHYVGMQHVNGYDGKVHVLACPECGEWRAVCPMCTGEDGAPGWYRGESTDKMLACHVCNQAEYAAQRRDPHF